jgi:hypothetical protein
LNRIKTFDNEEARLLLEQGDLKGAMTAVDLGLRIPVCAWLRKYFPSLHPNDLAGVWADTIAAAMDAIPRGRFDLSRPLFPWICRVAFNKATDHLPA